MARGWESKSVESQQEEAARAVAPATGQRVEARDYEQSAHRKTLELARARALADLAGATHPAHRAMLERAIETLDDQIAKAGRTAA